MLGIQAAGAGSDWKIGYGFLFGIMVAAATVLEVLAYLKRLEMRSLPPNFHTDPVGGATFPSNQALSCLFLPSFYIICRVKNGAEKTECFSSIY